ncbi:hypothetical protein FIBSPDRAFT_186319 [Athelia psychrophila]|uniref:RlpA-like protein double-psi beta-barrel domain-containing protein n=1 Tax=Athelia psychrophila TaxID=1759441 RepID=A0A166ABF9_9AGAM|nr:hypothetical protein FIBSPDRAFT_186319 [Fibularhizoctonia sp. CBS 109695]
MFPPSAICIFFFTVLALFVSSTTALTIRTSTESGDGTYYTPGLGACGKTNSESDHIVAVSHAFFDDYKGHTANPNDNPICGKTITIHYKGKSASAKIEDRCAGCSGWGDVDMTLSLFKEFSPQSAGRISDVTWTID